jgi:hypothetical protein
MGKSPLEHAHPPDNALGDWYAKVVSGERGEVFAFVSERSLLTVLTPAEDTDQLFADFVERAAQLFANLEMSEEWIDAELIAMQHIQVTATRSKPVVAALDEVAKSIQGMLEPSGSEQALESLELYLSGMEHKSLGNRKPREMARELLAARWESESGMA